MMDKTASALDVKDGDIIRTSGYRCRVSNVQHIEHNGEKIARYTLHSAPLSGERKLPPGFEGMRSGGNALAGVYIENREE